jgi:bifunctional DNA-binding transcriptional regulator/antitoxin component of YhaV-PrlF toxin-antitoxin module
VRCNVLPVKFESSVMQVGNSLRITIPQEVSKYLDIEKGDIVELWTENHSIVLEKKKLTFDAVWGFQEDILELRKNLGKNVIAHTSQPLGKPLHKYKGKLSITRDNFILEGQEVNSKQEATFLFSLQEITDVYLGWDETLRRFKDSRAWIRPLRITFKNETEGKLLYVYVKNPEGTIYGEENQKVYGILRRP